MAWVEKISNSWRMVDRGKIAGEIRRFSVRMENDTPECRQIAMKKLQEIIGKAVKAPDEYLHSYSVYYVTDAIRNSVKIGFSKNPVSRFKTLQISNCDRLELIHSIEFPNRRIARTAEEFLHKTFQDKKSESMSEWFNDSIIDELKENYWTSGQILEELKL